MIPWRGSPSMQMTIKDIATLETHTEGWIAGLQMAAHSMQSKTDSCSFISSFAGTHRLIGEHLTEEVFNSFIEDILSGCNYLASRPVLTGLMAVFVIGNFFLGNAQALLTPMILGFGVLKRIRRWERTKMQDILDI